MEAEKGDRKERQRDSSLLAALMLSAHVTNVIETGQWFPYHYCPPL